MAGHSVNSQLGPVRLTADPSGQIFASLVQTTTFGFSVVKKLHPPRTRIETKTIIRSLDFFIRRAG
jgi:hypothetical protein